MTESPTELEVSYPTDWRVIDVLSNTEVRQLSEHEYELRSAGYTLKVSEQAFNLYRDGSRAGEVIFESHCKRFGHVAVPRTDK